MSTIPPSLCQVAKVLMALFPFWELDQFSSIPSFLAQKLLWIVLSIQPDGSKTWLSFGLTSGCPVPWVKSI
jgi:hypothetical protein